MLNDDAVGQILMSIIYRWENRALLEKGFSSVQLPQLHHTYWVKSLFKRPLVKKEHLSPEVGHRQDNNVPV